VIDAQRSLTHVEVPAAHDRNGGDIGERLSQNAAFLLQLGRADVEDVEPAERLAAPAQWAGVHSGEPGRDYPGTHLWPPGHDLRLRSRRHREAGPDGVDAWTGVGLHLVQLQLDHPMRARRQQLQPARGVSYEQGHR
jgi:hypothetical protein